MDELSLFKIDSHEEHIKVLNEHATKVNGTLNSISDTLSLVNQNLEEQQKTARHLLNEITDLSRDLNSRIEPLEKDMIIRETIKSARQRFLANIATYMPLALFGLMLIYAIDFQRLVNLVSGVGIPVK
jgi:hypothetical protein